MGRVRRSPRIAHRTVEGEAAIVTVDDRKLHLLNDVGTLIFQSLNNPATIEDLTSKVVAEFDVTEERARQDCQAFCDELVKRKILEWVP